MKFPPPRDVGLALLAVGFDAGAAVIGHCMHSLGLPVRIGLKSFGVRNGAADLSLAAVQGGANLILLNGEAVGALGLLGTVSRLRASLPHIPMLVLCTSPVLRLAAMACGADLCSAGQLAPRELRAVVRMLLGRDTVLGSARGPNPTTVAGPPSAGLAAPSHLDPAANDCAARVFPAVELAAGVPAAGAPTAAAPACAWSLDPVSGALLSPASETVWLTTNEVRLLRAMLQGEYGQLDPSAWARLKHGVVVSDEHAALAVRDLPVAVSRLRAKVARQCTLELPLRAVCGMGYQFVGEMFLTSLSASGNAWQFDPRQRALRTPAGRSLRLSSREGTLLLAFMESDRQVVSSAGWAGTYPAARGAAARVDQRNLAVVVSRFKSKMLRLFGEEVPVSSIHGLGYQFVGRLEQIALAPHRPASVRDTGALVAATALSR